MKFENVRHVTRTTDILAVNKLLATGWVIIDTYKPDEHTLMFVLGLMQDKKTSTENND